MLLTGKNSNENTTSVAEVTISKTQHNQRIVRLWEILLCTSDITILQHTSLFKIKWSK